MVALSGTAQAALLESGGPVVADAYMITISGTPKSDGE
jgi:hypothetical protein